MGRNRGDRLILFYRRGQVQLVRDWSVGKMKRQCGMRCSPGTVIRAAPAGRGLYRQYVTTIIREAAFGANKVRQPEPLLNAAKITLTAIRAPRYHVAHGQGRYSLTHQHFRHLQETISFDTPSSTLHLCKVV